MDQDVLVFGRWAEAAGGAPPDSYGRQPYRFCDVKKTSSCEWISKQFAKHPLLRETSYYYDVITLSSIPGVPPQTIALKGPGCAVYSSFDLDLSVLLYRKWPAFAH